MANIIAFIPRPSVALSLEPSQSTVSSLENSPKPSVILSQEQGPQGPQGPQGLKGDAGSSIVMRSFLFTTPALEWIVEHNQGTQAFIAYIKDDQGTIMLAATEALSDLAFIVHLTCSMTGRVDVLFGAD